MASGSQNNTSYQAQKWTNLRAFTIGETAKNVDGTGDVSWSKDEILGTNDGSKFLRGDKTWSNILTDGLNLNGDLNLYTSSADSPDIVWWYENKNTEQARIWAGNGSTTAWAPYYRCYNSSGTQLYSGNLVLGDGTGAKWTSYRTSRDFTNGTLITTDLDGGQSSSSLPFLLKVIGNGYGDGFCEFYCQGYVYNLGNGYNSYINCYALSEGVSAPNKIYAFKNANGKLAFWFKRVSYWQGFNIWCGHESEYVSDTKPINHVTSVTDSPLPSSRSYSTEIGMNYSLTTANYTSYTVTKTGAGASGTWGISITGSSASCTGNAATATRINGNLGNATSNVARNIWVSSTNGADGIPQYIRQQSLALLPEYLRFQQVLDTCPAQQK